MSPNTPRKLEMSAHCHSEYSNIWLPYTKMAKNTKAINTIAKNTRKVTRSPPARWMVSQRIDIRGLNVM